LRHHPSRGHPHPLDHLPHGSSQLQQFHRTRIVQTIYRGRQQHRIRHLTRQGTDHRDPVREAGEE
jgi:hypothetical protein